MHRGTSLVETLVALSLIVVVTLFVFNLFVTTRKGLQLSENRASAAALGRSQLEEVRRAGFDNATAASGTYTMSGSHDGNASSVQLAWTRNIQVVDDTKKLLWIVISWHESTGDKQVVLETVLQK